MRQPLRVTNTGHRLTLRETRFIDNFLLTGNATEAYRIAYNKPDVNVMPTDTPEQRKEKERQKRKYDVSANAIKSKTYIAQEIIYRTECEFKANIASVSEIYAYLSRVVRGEEKDQFGLDVSVSERTKAASELLRRFVDIPNKLEKNEPQEVKITLDWGQKKDDLEVIDADINKKEDTKIGQITTQVGD